MDDSPQASIIGHLKSGKITIREADKKSVEVSAENNNVEVNILSLPVGISASRVIATISAARSLAKSLDERGVTLTVSSRSKPVVRLGRNARPKLSRLVTRSGSVEVSDLRELRRLDRRLRAG